MEYAAPKPIDGPDHQDVELPADGILQHTIECRTLIPTFGTADAFVLVGLVVGLDDQLATMLSATGARTSQPVSSSYYPNSLAQPKATAQRCSSPHSGPIWVSVATGEMLCAAGIFSGSQPAR